MLISGRRIGARLRGEQGVAVVAALGTIVVMIALGVAVTSTVGTNVNQTNRDRNVKRALAASEGAVQAAVYRMNMLQPTESNPCVTVSGGIVIATTASESNGWCSEESISLSDGSVATYQISPYTVEGGVVTRSVVSTASINGVSRRLKVTVSANTGAPIFGNYLLTADTGVALLNTSSIVGSVRSNKDIDLSGSATICGENTVATPGPGFRVNISESASVCGPVTPAQTPFVLTPVDQGDAATNNDNNRLFDQDPKTGSVSWNSSTRTLSMSGDSTPTLGGHTYSFCRLNLSNNSQLTVAADVVTRIYIDSTANCGLANNTLQFSMIDNAKLINTSQDPANFQVYMLGGTVDTPSAANIAGSSTTTHMTFYGPRSTFAITGESSWYIGAIAAKRIHISSGVVYDSRVSEIAQETIGVYRPQQFIECKTTNTGSVPDDGC